MTRWSAATTRKLSRLTMLASDALVDLQLGIWTAGPLRRRMPDGNARNVHYEPLRYPAIRALERRLALGPDDVVCDIGCGKGRVLCWFSRLPIAGVVGIDLDASLTVAAERNLRTLRGRRAQAQVLTEDATQADFDGVSVIIMFNPFGEAVMRAVLQSLRQSLERSPRLVRIAYMSPTQAHVLRQADFLRLVDEFDYPYENSREPAHIYEAQPAQAEPLPR